jgi:anaerobic selenocysteine-containing dehydrogenase
VREFGTNNLPDCSNMCHEASGRALTAAIGSGKGTVDLNDWEQADAIWLMGDNAATNAPRMLTWLAEANRRGAQLVHINPADRSGLKADDRAARVRQHGDVPHDRDRHDERTGAHWR